MKKFLIMIILLDAILLVLLLMLFTGCSSEYSGDFNRVSYSWAVQTLDDSNDPFDEMVNNDPHKDCRDKHHIDPYTKLEYCLPDDLASVRNINAYRVEK